MPVCATRYLGLLLWCGVLVPHHASARDTVDTLLARSEARLGGLGEESARPPKPPFAQALISPANIATFLAGVGVAEGINSQLFDDPMKLQEYFASLGRPSTYIAFMIFDMSRYAISRSLYPLTSNPYTVHSHRDLNFIDKAGGYIALAGASTVLHLLFEIIYSPHFKKLQTAADGESFERHLHALFRDNFLVADRWIARGIGATTLLAAAVSQGYVAGLRLPLVANFKSIVYRMIASRPLAVDNLLLAAAYDGRSLYVEDVMARSGAVSDADLAKYLHQPLKLKQVKILLPRFTLHGRYLAFSGAAIGVLLHVLDMALFIEFDHLYTALLEQPLWQLIYSRRIKKLTAAIAHESASATPDLSKLQAQLVQLAQSWNDYRMLFVLKPLMAFRSWHDELLRQDRRFYRRLAYYRWIVNGGDYHDAHFLANKHRWHVAPHDPEFQREKTAMLKDMLHGFRQIDFFNYTFQGKTLAHEKLPAIIPPAARQQYPRQTLALLQRMQEQRTEFVAMFERWGRMYGEKFEAQRHRYIARYNAKAREAFRKIYLTTTDSQVSLPRSPLQAFDREVADLCNVLQRTVRQHPQMVEAITGLQSFYAELSQPRAEAFLLDTAAHQQARQQLAARWQQFRLQQAELPAATRKLVEALSTHIELIMIYRFAFLSLGSYLLDNDKIYLEKEY